MLLLKNAPKILLTKNASKSERAAMVSSTSANATWPHYLFFSVMTHC